MTEALKLLRGSPGIFSEDLEKSHCCTQKLIQTYQFQLLPTDLDTYMRANKRYHSKKDDSRINLKNAELFSLTWYSLPHA